MPVNDSCPIRRNLVVASLLFIAFFWGGGVVTGESVKFPMVNVEFEHKGLLGVMSWGLLFWFCYRYWLEYRLDDFRKHFASDKVESMQKPWFCRIIQDKSGLPWVSEVNKLSELAMKPSAVGFHKGNLLVTYTVLRRMSNINDGTQRAFTPQSSEVVSFRGFKGLGLNFYLLYNAIVHHKSFGDVAVPYLLFGFAVLGGVVSCFQSTFEFWNWLTTFNSV